MEGARPVDGAKSLEEMEKGYSRPSRRSRRSACGRCRLKWRWRRGCARAYMSSRSRSRSGRHDDLLPRRRPLPALPPSPPSPPSPRLYSRSPRPRHRPRAQSAARLQDAAHADVMCRTSRRTCMRLWGGPRPRRPRPHSHARRPTVPVFVIGQSTTSAMLGFKTWRRRACRRVGRRCGAYAAHTCAHSHPRGPRPRPHPHYHSPSPSSSSASGAKYGLASAIVVVCGKGALSFKTLHVVRDVSFPPRHRRPRHYPRRRGPRPRQRSQPQTARVRACGRAGLRTRPRRWEVERGGEGESVRGRRCGCGTYPLLALPSSFTCTYTRAIGPGRGRMRYAYAVCVPCLHLPCRSPVPH
jgi:hypothetical protein